MRSDSIKKLRKRLKLTQAGAARLVGVSPNTWARWERGQSKPRGLLQRKTMALLKSFGSGKLVGAESDLQGNNTGERRTAPTLRNTRRRGAWYEVNEDDAGRSIPMKRNPARKTGQRDLTAPSSAQSLLKYAGTWVGDDLDECLREVYALRGRAKF